ncbi:MAG: hypothetical protein AB1567_04670 [bacterium]
MVPIVWIGVIGLVAIFSLGYAEVGQIGQTLAELKESAIKNNIEVVCKRQEIAEYKMSNSVLSNIKGVSSYNFETDTKFYGVMISVPLPFYFSYRKGLQLKNSELEKVKQEIITKVEWLYYEYCNLYERLQVAEKKAADQKSHWNNISVCKDVIEAEKEYRESQLRLTRAQRNLENVKVKIEVATATVKQREIKLTKLKKLYEYNRVEEDEVTKAREDLESKKGILIDLQMQEANLIDEIELLKMEMEQKKRYCQVAKEQTLSQAERDYKLALHVNGKPKLTHFWQWKLTHPCKKSDQK